MKTKTNIKKEKKLEKITFLSKHRYLCLIFLFALIIFIIIYFYHSTNKFNPEEDICLESNCKVNKYYFDSYTDTYGKQQLFDEKSCKDWTGELVCMEKREKSFCEKCVSVIDNEYYWTKECQDKCKCEEYEINQKEIEVESGVMLIPTYEITYDTESYDKIEIPSIEEDYINYTTEIIDDCGQYQCEKINITHLIVYEPVTIFTTEYVNETGKCLLATETPKPIKIDLEKEKCVEHTTYFIGKFKDYFVNCNTAKIKCEDTNLSFKFRESYCIDYDESCCIKKENVFQQLKSLNQLRLI